MKVLVIGSGGREHALAWKLKQSPRVSEVIVAPGNAGTASEPGLRNVPIAATDINALLHFAETENIPLTVVGPEAASSIASPRRDCAASARAPRPHSSKAPRRSPRTFSRATTFRLRTTPCSPNSRPRLPTYARTVRRS